MSDHEPKHVIVPEGQEAAFAQSLSGGLIEMEPVCPLCGHVGASRVDASYLDKKDRHRIPCYVTWSHLGVLAAVKDSKAMRRGQSIPHPDGGGGTTSEYHVIGVQCDECDWFSHASAFCRPSGPPRRVSGP